MTSDATWRAPIRWNYLADRAREKRRIFISLCDPFDDWEGQVEDHNGQRCTIDGKPLTLDILRERMWELVDATQNLQWLLFTKRPQNVRRMIAPCVVEPLFNAGKSLYHRQNVCLAVSISTQSTIDTYVPRLLELRDLFPVIALSIEPMLGAVELGPALQGLDWVIAGGESGPGHRSCSVKWIQNVADECCRASVAFWCKQDSDYKSGQQGRIPEALWKIKELPVWPQ